MKVVKIIFKLNESLLYRPVLVKHNDENGWLKPYWTVNGEKVAELNLNNVRVDLDWAYNTSKVISTYSCGYAFGSFLDINHEWIHKYFKNKTFHIGFKDDNCPERAEFVLSVLVGDKDEQKHIKKFMDNVPTNVILNDLKKLGIWFKNAKETKANIRESIKNHQISNNN